MVIVTVLGEDVVPWLVLPNVIGFGVTPTTGKVAVPDRFTVCVLEGSLSLMVKTPLLIGLAGGVTATGVYLMVILQGGSPAAIVKGRLPQRFDTENGGLVPIEVTTSEAVPLFANVID